MSGTSQKPAYVRTGTPMAAGAVLVYVAQQIGLDLSADQATILVPVVMYLYYVLGRALEAYNPRLGFVLGIAKQPAYSKQDAPAPDEGEHLEAIVVADKEPDAPRPARGDDGVPTQTDNGPKDDDEFATDQGEVFSGEMR